MKRQEWKEKAAEMSGVPKDVAMGLPILTITGTNDLCVENYRGMTEYTEGLQYGQDVDVYIRKIDYDKKKVKLAVINNYL